MLVGRVKRFPSGSVVTFAVYSPSPGPVEMEPHSVFRVEEKAADDTTRDPTKRKIRNEFIENASTMGSDPYFVKDIKGD